MRNFITFFLCLTLMISLISCGKNNSYDDLDTSATEEKNDLEDQSASKDTSADFPFTNEEESSSDQSLPDDNANTLPKIATELLTLALNCNASVYEADTQKMIYLKDYKTAYSDRHLCDFDELNYAYVDLDNDTINEVVIDCGDILILRYYKGLAFLYSYKCSIQLNTDGSFSWHYTGDDFYYGESKLYFEDELLKEKKLWYIVNDGEPNAEYYIEDKQVTQEEILKHFEKNPNTNIEFIPLEVSWYKTISSLKALEIASEYWDVKSGDIDKSTGYPFALFSQIIDNGNHRITLAWLVEDNHYSTIDSIEIDAFTGEIIVPSHEPGGKG